MYLKHFELERNPFGPLSDAEGMYSGSGQRSALEGFGRLLYTISERPGIALLVGGPGVGKSLILKALLSRIWSHPYAYRGLYIADRISDEPNLYRAILRELGEKPKSSNIDDLRRQLKLSLVYVQNSGARAVLILDEAQNLSPNLLEEIRLISNMEMRNSPLLQLILSGHTKLAKMLQKSELRSLDQRIAIRFFLDNMGWGDTVAYIKKRLLLAGGGEATAIIGTLPMLPIYLFTGGNPRLINRLCDSAMVAAYSDGVKEVTVSAVIKGMKESRSISMAAWAAGWFGTVSIAVAAVMLGGYLYTVNVEGRAEAGIQQAELNGILKTKQLQDSSILFRPDAKKEAIFKLLSAWSLNHSPTNKLKSSIEAVAKSQGLKCFTADMDVEALRKLDYPAILQLKGDGGAGFMPLLAVYGRRYVVNMTTGDAVDKDWLLANWTGRTYIFWKDYEQGPSIMRRGAKGKHVQWVQKSMNDLGYSSIPLSGYYGGETMRAVLRFQSDNRLGGDGSVNPLTKMFIYKRLPDVKTPGIRLTEG